MAGLTRRNLFLIREMGIPLPVWLVKPAIHGLHISRLKGRLPYIGLRDLQAVGEEARHASDLTWMAGTACDFGWLHIDHNWVHPLRCRTHAPTARGRGMQVWMKARRWDQSVVQQAQVLSRDNTP